MKKVFWEAGRNGGELIALIHIEAKSIKDAKSKVPWAYRVVRVFGGYGYMAFESIDDYNVWRNQK